MIDIDKVLDSNEEIDNDLNFKNAYKKALDIDFKKELKNEFESKYRSEGNKNSRPNILNLKTFIGIAASIILIVALIFLMTPGEVNYNELMAIELSHKVDHTGNTKGGTDPNRLKAITNYNNSDYINAIESYIKVVDKTSEDNYFLALSYFYSNDFNTAINVFSTLLDSPFSQEARWYQGLAYLQMNDKTNAIETLNKIKEKEWKHKEAKVVLKELGI